MTRDELLKRLADADIAFAEVNTMADLAIHPHLRRIEVDTPNGRVSYAAPAPIFVGETRAVRRGARRSANIANCPRRKSERECVMTEKLDIDHLRQWIGSSRSHRHRHRAARERPARDAVPGGRRTQDGRRCAVHGALVPGAAGVSDVDARARRPSDPRWFPAAGAAAAPDVGRRRDRVFRAAARRR